MVLRQSSLADEAPLQAYIDSHCHLDFSDFDDDRQYVWSTARTAGVIAGVVPGVAAEQWHRARLLAQQYFDLYYSAGVHPWWVDNQLARAASLAEGVEALRVQLDRELQHDKCVAVGECGLDKSIGTPLDRQAPIFDFHIALANLHELPLILHCRKAHNEALAKLRRTPVARGGVVHGFSGSHDLAMRFIQQGFYIGVGGTITYPRANKTREAIKALPLDRLVLETDSPDMPLEGQQGQRNSPENIPRIACALAELRNEPLATIAEVTRNNTCTLYGLKLSNFGA